MGKNEKKWTILALILKNHNQVRKIEYLWMNIYIYIYIFYYYSNKATPTQSFSKTYLFAEISAGFI